MGVFSGPVSVVGVIQNSLLGKIMVKIKGKIWIKNGQNNDITIRLYSSYWKWKHFFVRLGYVKIRLGLPRRVRKEV